MFVKPANLGSSVGISKAKDARRAHRRDGPRRRVRPQDRDRGRRAARPARSNARCSATTRRRRRCPAKSFRRASSTTTRRSTWTTDRRSSSRRILAPNDGDRDPAAVDRGVPGHRLRRHGARRLPVRGATGEIFVNEVNTIPGFTTISMYSKLWAATGVDVPGAARSADRARARTARRKAAAPHQRHMTAHRGWRVRPGSQRGRRHDRPAPRARHPRRRRRSPAPTTSSSKPASIRSTPSCAARADRRRPRPATCSPPRRSGGGSCSIPRAARSTTSSPPPSIAPSSTTEAWTERAPDDAEAWFYLGGAYAARVQWRVLRDEKLAAARDGKNIKVALERAIELDPDLEDAYFGIGMYKYYADVAPAAAKVLRFLLLLPGGDRKEGLEQMLRARNRGRLLQGEADYQLHVIYLWYERQTPRALQLLAGAARALPGQSALPRPDRRDPGRVSARHHRQPRHLAALLGAAREQRVNAPGAERGAGAPRHRASSSKRCTRPTMRSRCCSGSSRLRPRRRIGSLPLAYLRLGEAYDRLGARAGGGGRLPRRDRGGARRRPARHPRRRRPSISGTRPNAGAPRRTASRSRAGAGSKHNDLPASADRARHARSR